MTSSRTWRSEWMFNEASLMHCVYLPNLCLPDLKPMHQHNLSVFTYILSPYNSKFLVIFQLVDHSRGLVSPLASVGCIPPPPESVHH